MLFNVVGFFGFVLCLGVVGAVVNVPAVWQALVLDSDVPGVSSISLQITLKLILTYFQH